MPGGIMRDRNEVDETVYLSTHPHANEKYFWGGKHRCSILPNNWSRCCTDGIMIETFFDMYVFYFHKNTILIVCLTERMYLKVNIQQNLMNLNKNHLSMFTLELGWFSSKSSYFRSMKGKPDAWFLLRRPRESRTWHDLCSCHGLSVFSLNRKLFFLSRITDFKRFSCLSPLLLSPGDLSSAVALALSGSLWTGRPGPAHDHQPESPSAAAPAVSLPGQTSWCRSPPHGPLRHLWFYRERQLPLQWTRWPLCASQWLQTQPTEDQ